MASAYDCNVVIDLEFTPVPKAVRGGTGLRQEIIEVGAVKLDPEGNVVGEFSHVVRPTMARSVSGQVRCLTGIVNGDIACARPLEEVIGALAAWIGPCRARMVTWSGSDLKQITVELGAKGIECALPHRWMDIQPMYAHFMGLGRKKVALCDAADWLGIPNDRSRAHRALYDAQLTREVFNMMAKGELAEHRRRVRQETRDARAVGACSTSIGSRCGGLAGLLASLMAEEAQQTAACA